MRQRATAVALVTAAVIGLAVVRVATGCTALVAGAGATADHAPVLWKNRDTGTLSNKLLWVDESPHDYLCLANAESDSGRFCYAGLNDAGFAIINTVAYNLPEESGEMADLEGQLMAEALRTCRTVDDFARFLAANTGPDLGSLANFGVFDGSGSAAVFETHNHGFERLDAARAPGARMVVTNFARSGAEGEGHGYLRFDRARELVAAFAPGALDARAILHRFTRDLGHALLDHPQLDELAVQPPAPSRWISSRDCVDRFATASAVVIVGRSPLAPARPATLWVIPGEPLTAVAVPVWVEAGRSPAPLHSGEEAPLWRESRRIKQLLRPQSGGHRQDYLDLTRLDNAAGTGFLPGLLEAETGILDETAAFLAEPRTADELAVFADRMAAQALAAMAAASRVGDPSQDAASASR
jgi:hypothetical protein